MKKKIREGFISASYKKSVRVVCSIIAYALAVVLVIFELYAIVWVPVILLTFTMAIKETDIEVVEKTNCFLLS